MARMIEELREYTGNEATQIAQEIEDREQEAIEAWEKEMEAENKS